MRIRTRIRMTMKTNLMSLRSQCFFRFTSQSREVGLVSSIAPEELMIPSNNVLQQPLKSSMGTYIRAPKVGHIVPVVPTFCCFERWRGAPCGTARCSSVPRGSSTQWATAGAPEAHCGKQWWAMQGKEPPTKPGWAEPRTTARSQCSVKHPGHCAGAHAACVNHEAHATRNQQGTRPAHARPTEWGSVCVGRPGQRVEEQGTWASGTRKHSEAGCGRPEDGGVWTAKTVKQPLQQPAQPQQAKY